MISQRTGYVISQRTGHVISQRTGHVISLRTGHVISHETYFKVHLCIISPFLWSAGYAKKQDVFSSVCDVFS